MERYVPSRQCIGCGRRIEKAALLRIIRTKEQEIRLDPTGRGNGRGAYLCRNAACVKAARKKHALERALKSNIPAAIYDEADAYVAAKGAEDAAG